MLVGALGSCASGYGPGPLDPCASEAEVRARMGPPTREHLGPDGLRRLEYARGPYGRHTYMADLDAQGRVKRWTQVLAEQEAAGARTLMLAQPSVIRRPVVEAGTRVLVGFNETTYVSLVR